MIDCKVNKNKVMVFYYSIPFLLVSLSVFFGVEVVSFGHLSVRLGFLFFLFGFFYWQCFFRKKFSVEDLYLVCLVLFSFKSFFLGAGFAALAWPIMMLSAYLFGIKISILDENIKKKIKDVVFVVFVVCLFLFVFLNFFELLGLVRGVVDKRSIHYFFGYYEHYNIAASTLGLLAIYFSDNKKKFVFLILCCLVFSVINSTRVGFISFLMAIVFFYMSNYKSNMDKHLFAFLVFVGGCFLAPLMLPDLFGRLGDFETELEYFETGQGRIALWLAAINTLEIEVLGFGIGESKDAIVYYSQFPLAYREDALHNIYLQTLVDNGVFCFVLLLSVFFKYVFSLKEYSNVKTLVFVFLFLSLFQNSGYEHFIWFFMGYAQNENRYTV